MPWFKLTYYIGGASGWDSPHIIWSVRNEITQDAAWKTVNTQLDSKQRFYIGAGDPLCFQVDPERVIYVRMDRLTDKEASDWMEANGLRREAAKRQEAEALEKLRREAARQAADEAKQKADEARRKADEARWKEEREKEQAFREQIKARKRDARGRFVPVPPPDPKKGPRRRPSP